MAEPSMPETDEALVARAQRGEAPAFAALVRRHSAASFRLAVRLTGSEADAEEAVQEAFLQMHRGLAGFRGDARVSTWLYRIVTNAALMQARRRSRRTESLEAYLPAFGPDGLHAHLDASMVLPSLPDEDAARAELRDRALAVLAALPEGQRAAFVLRDLEGLSSDEVGEVLGLDAAAVRQRVHRARLVLRGALMETMEGHPR
jgi:RNA polymerase sigma-70 factor (ECF subfamily)